MEVLVVRMEVLVVRMEVLVLRVEVLVLRMEVLVLRMKYDDDLLRPQNYRWNDLIGYKRSVFGGYGKNGRAALLNVMYG
uniref:Uncharacterized protein n=1 Tax=Parascaris univalens TaxID=6257 RepID=A0A915CGX1_PARUN